MSNKQAKDKKPVKAKAAEVETVEAEPTEEISVPVNGVLADELDAAGAQIVEYHEWPRPEKVVFDTTPCDQPDLVPDPPGHGRYDLLADVDFVGPDGEEVHFDAGVVNNGDLPEEFAATLMERGLLVKKRPGK